jgi:hypothetical protein
MDSKIIVLPSLVDGLLMLAMRRFTNPFALNDQFSFPKEQGHKPGPACHL